MTLFHCSLGRSHKTGLTIQIILISKELFYFLIFLLFLLIFQFLVYNQIKCLTFFVETLKYTFSSTSAKELAYKSLIRPTLEYTCSAWDPYNKDKIDQLKMVQHRAARFFSQRNVSSVGDMLQRLNWCSVGDRHKEARLVMVCKIANENVAITKTDKLTSP